MSENKLGKRFTQLLDETATREEVAQFFKKLTELLKEYKLKTDETMASHKGEVVTHIDSNIGAIQDHIARLESADTQTEATFRSELRTITRLIEQSVNDLRNEIPLPTDLTPLQQEFQTRLSEVEGKIPALPTELSAENVRDKLQSLTGENRLDKSAIKGLDEALTRITSATARGGSQGGRPVHVPMMDDFTAQTDGSTKTFYLSKQPRSLTTIKAWGSDFPNIMTIQNGFSVAGKLLTIGDDYPAPSDGGIFVVEYFV